MTARPAPVPELCAKRIDISATIRDFLKETTVDDVVIELIQNDLDAGATETTLHFGEHRLRATGNGKRIDKAGWKRLSYTLGAGEEVSAKSHGMGIKNHGIRTLWHLGNIIRVYSDGLVTYLVLSDEEGKHQGAYKQPISDDHGDGPEQGVCVEVDYWHMADSHEASIPAWAQISPLSRETLHNKLNNLIVQLPKRLLGIIQKNGHHHYQLTIEIENQGTHRFVFSKNTLRNNPNLWCRRCTYWSNNVLKTQRTERVVNITVPLSALNTTQPDRLPCSLITQRGALIEYAWPVDKQGRLQEEEGDLRYPIGFPNERANMGFSISAPFDCNRSRHNANELEWNQAIRNEVEKGLPKVIREVICLHDDPRAINLIRSPNADETTINRRLKDLFFNNTIPVSVNGKHRLAKKRNEADVYLPHSANGGYFSKNIARYVPKKLVIIDPRTPDFAFNYFVELANSTQTSREGMEFYHFDESDICDLLCPPERSRYAERSDKEWKNLFASTGKLRALLNVVNKADSLDRSFFSPEHIHLLDKHRAPHPAKNLCNSSAYLPELNQLELPKLIHPDISKHPALVKMGLTFKEFTFQDWGESLVPSSLTYEDKITIYAWITRNNRELLARAKPGKRSALDILLPLPVWLTNSNEFVPFSELCQPDSCTLPESLIAVLSIPDRSVLKIQGVKTSGRKCRLKLRTRPNEKELKYWFNEHLSLMQSKPDTVSHRRFENELASLAKDSHLKKTLKELFQSQHLTITADGQWKEAHTLSSSICAEKYRLLDEDTLDSSYPLEHVFPPPATPLSSAIIRALKAVPDMSRLGHRLKAIWNNWKSSFNNSEFRELTNIPLVYTNGRWYHAKDIAITGKTPLWGDWRTKVPQSVFDNATCKLLEELGAASFTLTEYTSQQFFLWLSTQHSSVIKRHLRCVLHHWNNTKCGPSHWWNKKDQYHDNDYISCIPVRKGENFDLVSYAKRKNIWLANDPMLKEAALKDGTIALIVNRLEGIIGTIDSKLGGKEVRYLSDAEPVGSLTVDGASKPIEEEELLELIHQLCIPKNSDIVHRLSDFTNEDIQLRRGWRNSLRRIKEVKTASNLHQVYRLGKAKNAKKLKVNLSSTVHDCALYILCEHRNYKDALFLSIAKELFTTSPIKLMHGQAIKHLLTDNSHLYDDLDPHDAPEDDPPEDDDPEPDNGNPSHHPDWDPNPEREDPNTNDQPPKNKQNNRKNGQSSSKRRYTADEKKQKDKVNDYYAMHCQCCLAEHTPSFLSKKDSYGEFYDQRRYIMEVHHFHGHADGGVMHESNLACVCKKHHRIIGDHISPMAIRKALSTSEETIRSFRQKTIKGETITVIVNGEKVRFWFRTEHAEAWRQAWPLDEEVDST